MPSVLFVANTSVRLLKRSDEKYVFAKEGTDTTEPGSSHQAGLFAATLGLFHLC